MKIQNADLDKFFAGIRAIRDQGGKVDYEYGDSTIPGRAEVKGVVAEFEYNQGELTVEILDKPFFASQSMIEDKIKEYFT